MIKSILTQTKIMLNKKGFMFGFSAMMMICLLEVVFSSYGVTALRMEGDGFPGNDPSSVITSFEAFILCVPSGLLSYLELLFPFDRKKMSTKAKNGKHAVTHYTVLRRFKDYTYIECELETGRTHQIRVHMASIGHPILGDSMYGPSKCPFKLQGQTLHAKVLGITHPSTGKYIEVDAPLPEYFNKLLKQLEER